MPKMFEAPIPGQSLTTPPRSMPYERPPEISDPEEAIQMHLQRLSKKEMIEDTIDALELGVSVVELTEGILRSAVATGIHSVDVSLAIAPVIHEFIKSNADTVGIEYDEGFEDEKQKQKEKTRVGIEKEKFKLEKERGSKKKKTPQADLQMDSEELPDDAPAGDSSGFVKRRGK